MKTYSIKKVIMRSTTALVLLLGLLSGVATTSAVAQGRRVHHRQRIVIVRRPFFPHFHSYYYGVYDPIAYQREQGYSDGLSRGKSDAKHGKPSDPQSHKHYRNSDSMTYRDAFLQGYTDGYIERRG